MTTTAVHGAPNGMAAAGLSAENTVRWFVVVCVQQEAISAYLCYVFMYLFFKEMCTKVNYEISESCVWEAM